MRGVAGDVRDLEDRAEDGCYEGEVGGVDERGAIMEDDG